MTTGRNRNTETVVYMVIWLIVIGLYLLDTLSVRSQMGLSSLDASVPASMMWRLLPFAVLFTVNNYILIPRLLLKNRWKPYFAVTALLVLCLWGWQYCEFMGRMAALPEQGHPIPSPPFRPLLPMPVLLDFIYTLLTVGCNLAVALMFQRFEDKLEQESLMKAGAESQLAYLKAQINPHFYMNMLNNIHGLIEIDPDRAQHMLLDLSNLMRYMLYDSSRTRIPLGDEIAFLNKYLNLIRMRYPADRVTVSASLPDPADTAGIYLPPLLFLVFIENAFKHGISYQRPSYVAVSLEVSDGRVRFGCVNSTHPGNTPAAGGSGIGLANIRRRLELLYGDRAGLEMACDGGSYTVILSIPVSDAQDSDHR